MLRAKKRIALASVLVGLLLAAIIPAFFRARRASLNRELVQAAYAGDLGRATGLLDLGADPDATVDSNAPAPFDLLALIKSVFSRSQARRQAASALQGAVSGSVPSYAISRGREQSDRDANAHAEVAKLLLARGARRVNGPGRVFMNGPNETLLMSAIRTGDPLLVKALLERGAQINTRDWIRNTPLAYAVTQRSPEMVRLLLERGADPSTYDQAHRTILQCACGPQTPIRIVELLLDHGADVNGRCQVGMTPLMHAAWMGNPATVRILLERGADPTLVAFPFRKRRTVLDFARARGDSLIIRMLDDAVKKRQQPHGSSQDRNAESKGKQS